MADNTRKTSNIIHTVEDLQEQIDDIVVGDGEININASNGVKVSDDNENATANQSDDTTFSVEADMDFIQDNITFPPPVTPGDGAIALVEGDGIAIDGDDAKANQAGDTSWTVSVDETVAKVSDIPSVGDGNIELEASNGVKTSAGSQDAKANQDDDTTFKIEADLDYLNDNLDFPDVPTVGDGDIRLTASNGVKVSDGSQDANANQGGNTTFKVEADLEYLNDNLDIPAVGVTKIIAGTNVSVTPPEGTGEVTINASGGDGGGIEEAPNDGQNYTRGNLTWNPIPSPVVPGDGAIALKSTDGSVSIVGSDATANQSGNTEWDISVPTPSDATLPISSEDDTVKLDSPAADVFTVTTGGTERMRATNLGLRVTYGSTLAVGTNPQANIGIYNYAGLTASGASGMNGVLSLPNISGVTTGVFRGVASNVNTASVSSVDSIHLFAAMAGGNYEGAITNELVGYVCENLPSEGPRQIGMKLSVSEGDDRYNIYADGDARNFFLGDVIVGTEASASTLQTSIITSAAAALDDAKIQIGQGLLFNGNLTSGDTKTVAQFISNNLQPSRGLKVNVGTSVSGSAVNGAVELDVRAGNAPIEDDASSFALFSISTDGQQRLGIGKVESGEALDIRAWEDYEPLNPQSLVTKGWVEANTSTGDFLPMSGGTMDENAAVIIPSSSTGSLLQVGGADTDPRNPNFQVVARGGADSGSSQLVSWAQNGKNALVKLCVSEDVSEYWNLVALPANVDGDKYFRIANEDTNWLIFQKVGGQQSTWFTQDCRFSGKVQADIITSEAAAVGDAKIQLGENIGLNASPAANVMLSGNTDQPFFQNFLSANDYLTGLYEGRCGSRIGNNTNGSFYAEWYLDPTAKTYGLGGSSSGGSMPIIGGGAQADIEVKPKTWTCFNTPDIKAADGYTPQGDSSLVTKGWVEANAGGGTGSLPISSVDSTITLDGAAQVFGVKDDKTDVEALTDAYHFEVSSYSYDDGSVVSKGGQITLSCAYSDGTLFGPDTGNITLTGKKKSNPRDVHNTELVISVDGTDMFGVDDLRMSVLGDRLNVDNAWTPPNGLFTLGVDNSGDITWDAGGLWLCADSTWKRILAYDIFQDEPAPPPPTTDAGVSWRQIAGSQSSQLFCSTVAYVNSRFLRGTTASLDGIEWFNQPGILNPYTRMPDWEQTDPDEPYVVYRPAAEGASYQGLSMYSTSYSYQAGSWTPFSAADSNLPAEWIIPDTGSDPNGGQGVRSLGHTVVNGRWYMGNQYIMRDTGAVGVYDECVNDFPAGVTGFPISLKSTSEARDGLSNPTVGFLDHQIALFEDGLWVNSNPQDKAGWTKEFSPTSGKLRDVCVGTGFQSDETPYRLIFAVADDGYWTCSIADNGGLSGWTKTDWPQQGQYNHCCFTGNKFIATTSEGVLLSFTWSPGGTAEVYPQADLDGTKGLVANLCGGGGRSVAGQYLKERSVQDPNRPLQPGSEWLAYSLITGENVIAGTIYTTNVITLNEPSTYSTLDGWEDLKTQSEVNQFIAQHLGDIEGQVGKFPTTSEDGTVVVDSPSSNELEITGASDVRVPDGYVPAGPSSLTNRQYVDERTTADLALAEPVDPGTVDTVDASATLYTQEDANAYFEQELQTKATEKYVDDAVANLSGATIWQGTQTQYDAIPAENIDDNTLYLISGV